MALQSLSCSPLSLLVKYPPWVRLLRSVTAGCGLQRIESPSSRDSDGQRAAEERDRVQGEGCTEQDLRQTPCTRVALGHCSQGASCHCRVATAPALLSTAPCQLSHGAAMSHCLLHAADSGTEAALST